MKTPPDTFVLENECLRVEIPARTMAMRVIDKRCGATWQMPDESLDEVVIEGDGVVTTHTLAAAERTDVRLQTGTVLLLDFADYRLQLLVGLDADSLQVQLAPLGETHAFRLKGLVYPRCFGLKDAQAPEVFPHAQALWVDELVVATKRIGPLHK
jgi:hypothetical protein